MTQAVVDPNALAETVKANGETIQVLTKNFNDFIDAMKRTPAFDQPRPEQVFGLPNARHGENALASRGYSFSKMLGLLTGVVPREEAKVEIDIANRMDQALRLNLPSGSGYEYRGVGHTGMSRFLAPLGTNYLQDMYVDGNFRREMRDLIHAGTIGADPNEMGWLRQKQLGKNYHGKTLSWLNELTGGALVAPPEMGELIELLRNKEALVNAGARTIPLPPQGRLKFPRQTAASTTYWVGENKTIADSDIGTGEVTLQAKKLAVLIQAPNELLRFASPAAEALIRDDMTKSLALALDMAGLEGTGGDYQPLGILNTTGINTVTSSDARVNGDRLVGQDFYRMVAAVEESNAEGEGWIMRPKTLYKAYQLRADAVGAGDGQGPFLFSLIREADDVIKPTIAGYPVTKSTQVSQVRSKGVATDLTYILFGMWSDFLIGMFGAIEFASTTQGDTAFQRDQTWVRGILTADCAPRHAAAFSLLDTLSLSI